MKGKNIERILIVEDIDENLETARQYFQSVGVDIDCAKTRDEALKKVNKTKYKGAIIDRGIPPYEGDAWGFAVALRAEEREIPWLVFSEHGTLNFYYPKNKQLSNQFTIKSVRVLMGQKYSSDVADEYTVEEFEKRGLSNYKVIKHPNSKEDPRSWEIAYKILKEKIKQHKK